MSNTSYGSAQAIECPLCDEHRIFHLHGTLCNIVGNDQHSKSDDVLVNSISLSVSLTDIIL
jgi:hypothetical protein